MTTDPGRTAVVTGAARGIGAATVRTLIAQGWSVLAVDAAADVDHLSYPMASPDELVASVEGLGVPDRVATHVADVRDFRELSWAVEDAESRWGGLDAAIACAGAIAGGAPQWEVPMEKEEAILAINLQGVLNLSRCAVPALLRRPEPRTGRFVAVSSAAATRGLPMLAAYCAAKAGVNGAVRALAVELGAAGITANVVSAGSTRTSLLDESARIYGLSGADAFAAQQPLERLLDPNEIAAAVAFVAGANSGGMTGAVIPVDGGLAL